MERNKIIICFLVHFISISIVQVGVSLEDGWLNLKVRIFRILPFQTIVKAKSISIKDGKVGGIQGGIIRENVTASFPDGIVLLETDLNQDNADLDRLIKEKVKFSCLSKRVGISQVDTLNISINAKNFETFIAGEGLYPKIMYGHGGYRLIVVPLAIEKDELILRVKFQGFEKKLLDQTIGVKFAKTLLVGFPSKDFGGRGAIYWLAFSFEDCHKKKI